MVKLTAEEQLRFNKVLMKYHVYLEKRIRHRAKTGEDFNSELFNLYRLGFIEARYRENKGITHKEYQLLLDWEIVTNYNFDHLLPT